MSHHMERRRGPLGGCRAAIDELSSVIVEPILAAPEHERKGYAAVLGVVAAALAALYIGSWIVGKMRGWW